MNRLSRTPYASFLLAAAAVVIHELPGAATRLQYDRAAIAAGELWRILSSHWTHVSIDHLFWNVLAFVVLGVLCERLSRRSFFVAVTSSAILIPLVLWITSPHLAAYRGLSGIDSALFALLAVTLLKSQTYARRWPSVAALSFASLVFLAKIGYEAVTGETLFVDSRAAPIFPVPLAHGVGAAVGATVALTDSRRRGGIIKAPPSIRQRQPLLAFPLLVTNLKSVRRFSSNLRWRAKEEGDSHGFS